MKKILSLILVTAMVIGVMSLQNAIAEERENEPAFSDVSIDSSYYESVKDLNALGIMQGYPDGIFELDKQITRAEMATITLKAMGYKVDYSDMPDNMRLFTDVETTHWAYCDIYVASQRGIINGKGDGTFLPDEHVSYKETMKMIVCGMGYKYAAESYGGYSAGYLVCAKRIGFTIRTPETIDAPITRGEVAELLHAALDLPIMPQFDTPSDYPPTTLREAKHEAN